MQPMQLIPASTDVLRSIMQWLPDRRSALLWGGPKLRFPLTAETLLEDSRFADLPSYALVGAEGELLGFGQYYLRAGRCHLGRLIIAPERRGAGLGPWLVGGLVGIGAAALSVPECSLFVLPDNQRARRLYDKLGFTLTTYPEAGHETDGFHYMIASVETLRPWRLA
jgi:ribosomal protein S18 acetylase RimI-like enzyme